MPKINVEAITANLAAVSTLMPQLVAAYHAYRAIWTLANPGKTEQDYLDHLGQASTNTISSADAILLADGYVRDDAGSWHKPSA